MYTSKLLIGFVVLLQAKITKMNKQSFDWIHWSIQIHSGTMCHTSAEGHLGYEKCLQGSVNWFWAILMGYFENLLSPKYWLGAFWENQLN